MNDDELDARIAALSDDPARQMAIMTAVKRMLPMLRNIATNLRTLEQVPMLTAPQWHGPAFIVGGGPSLAQLTPDLARVMSERGVVFAVNTSEKPLRERGITPTLCWCIESGATSFQIAESPPAQQWALDITCHPDSFKAAEGRCAWFMHEALHLMELARCLGARPIWYGPAGPSAAFTFARAMGCSPIVLVGCDMAYGRDGRMYDKSTHWHELAVDVKQDGDKAIGEFTESKVRDDVMRKAGMKPIPPRRRMYQVPAADGGEPLWTTPEFMALNAWLAREISVMPAGSVVQTGLAALAGAEYHGIEDAIRHCADYPDADHCLSDTRLAHVVHAEAAERIASARALILREADTMSACADAIESGARLPYQRMAEGTAFGAAWSVPELLRYQMSDDGNDVIAKPAAVAAIWRRAAAEMREAIGG